MSKDTPAPAPMTARLRELMEEATPLPCTIGARRDKTVWMSLGDQVKGPYYQGDFAGPFKDAVLFQYLRFNAPTILRLLEAVEGAEKALEYYAANCADMPPWRVTDAAGGLIADWEGFTERARSALATLRAAREGAR